MPWLIKRLCKTCGRSFVRLTAPPLGDPICDDCSGSSWLDDIEAVRSRPTSRYQPEPEHGGEA